jgi:hypothetical protein
LIVPSAILNSSSKLDAAKCSAPLVGAPSSESSRGVKRAHAGRDVILSDAEAVGYSSDESANALVDQQRTTMAKGQVKSKKDNKPKLSVKEKRQKKKEKAAAKAGQS